MAALWANPVSDPVTKAGVPGTTLQPGGGAGGPALAAGGTTTARLQMSEAKTQ